MKRARKTSVGSRPAAESTGDSERAGSSGLVEGERSPRRPTEPRRSPRLGIVALALALVVASATPPASAFACNLIFRFDAVKRNSIQTTANATGTDYVTLVLSVTTQPEIQAIVSCADPSIEPWPIEVLKLAVYANVNTEAAEDALERCSNLALLVQQDPSRFKLDMWLGVEDGDRGVVLRGAQNNLPHTYQVIFDDTSFIECALITQP